MKLRPLRWRLEYAAFRAFGMLLQTLTPRWAHRAARAFAWIMLLLPGKWTRYNVARENLKLAMGDSFDEARIRETIRGMWIHLFRMIVEILQLPQKMTLTNCRDVVVFRNRGVVMKALCSGRPLLMLGGHFGNWEISMATFGFFGMRMGVVARALDNPYLHDWFRRFRESTGHAMLLKKGGFDEMVDLLEKGGSLGALCDQDAGKRGLFVDFFGHSASTFKSIALMALQYKMLIIVGYGIRLPDDFENARWSRFEIGCEELIDPLTIQAEDEILEITQRFTSALERAIRRAPDQYFWVHRRWKTPPRTPRNKSAA